MLLSCKINWVANSNQDMKHQRSHHISFKMAQDKAEDIKFRGYPLTKYRSLISSIFNQIMLS